MPPLVEVAAGAHEAAHHGGYDRHEQEDGGGNASQGGRAELEEHAAFLLPLRDHLEGVQAAVAPVAVSTAERDQRAVEAVVPCAVFIHVPQTVLVPADVRGAEDDGEQRQSQRDEGHVTRWRNHRHPRFHRRPRE